MKRISRRGVLRASAISAAALGGLNLSKDANAQFSWMKPKSPGQGQGGPRRIPFADDNPAIRYFPMNCERCGDCVAVCQTVQTVYGYGNFPAGTVPCIYCGQCTANCWNSAVTERFHLQDVFDAMQKNRSEKGTKKFVALVAPSTRVTLGEMLKMGRGVNVEKQMITALRKLGFDYVFDVTFGADLTVMEEAAELEAHLKQGQKKTPLFTSCCPAWVRFAQLFFPDAVPQISSCKSPVMMQGSVIKTWFAEQKKLKPEDLVVVTVTPCTAKKYERTLGKLNEVDFALTTRELGWWILEMKQDFAKLEPGTFDSLIGTGSGAGVIFGSTGGVTEAVLRQIYFKRTGKEPPKDFLAFTPVRGMDGVRRADVEIEGQTLRVGIVHGTSAVRELMKALGSLNLDFVEVMACRGGCIGGGGLPKTEIPISDALRTERKKGLYATDAERAVRLSGANPEIQKIYAEFLHEPGSPLLHTEH